MEDLLLIENAQIATDTEVFAGSVLVRGQQIAGVYRNGAPAPEEAKNARRLDAGGKYLLPGGVDPHTHLGLNPDPDQARQDFLSSSIGAACGGTTTIIEHPGFGPAGCPLPHQIGLYHQLAAGCAVDYGFHGVVQHVDDEVLADMARLRDDEGITSHKIYLTYAGMLQDPDVLRVLRRAKELGIMLCVHCENDAIIAARQAAQRAKGQLTPRFHPLARPAQAEAEAVFRMLMLAAASGEPLLYIVHLSTLLGLGAIRLARQNGQANIFAETCPQYLLLEDDIFTDDPDSLRCIMAPPTRKTADRNALWQALAGDEIDTLGTDHCPFTLAQKRRGQADYMQAPGGIPGVEPRLALMFSEGFMKGRLTLPQVVRTCCARPASLFGLGRRKGHIRPGADADLVLFDPEAAWTLGAGTLHEGVDFTPYEGLKLRGRPVLTLLRGRVVAENGAFTGAAGGGQYLPRGLPLA